MNNSTYILPVSATYRDIKYPEKIVNTVEGLERRLKGRKLNISIGKKLHKDSLSDLYEGTLDRTKVLVKHTENVVPQTPIEFLIMSDGFNTDITILKLLDVIEEIKVPKIIHNAQKFATVVLEDVRTEGYSSLAEQISQKKLSMQSAAPIGRSLAHLAAISQKWEEFKTNESAQLSFYERSLEMLVSIPNDREHYRFLEDQFTQFEEEKEDQLKRIRFFVWPDSNPSNMMVNKQGAVVFTNFNRSHWGDQQYMLAVFVGHIMMYSLLGFIQRGKAVDYLKTCIKAYKEVSEIRDEYIFSQYVGMEILHQSFGKGIPITSIKDKISLQKLGMAIIDAKVKTMTSLINQFKKAK